MTLQHRISLFLGALAVLALAAPALAQRASIRLHREPLAIRSGEHSVPRDAAEHDIAFVHVFAQPRAPWMRLQISDANLGQRSFIVLRSMRDNGQQRLNATSLAQWRNATAIFNGDRVLLELHVAPGDEGVFANFDQIIYGDLLPEGDDGGIATLCGADNRVASGDNRVGRLYFGGCTAWRTTAGAYLTAGHCVDFDPDDGGPLLPDGVLDLSGVVEFNVPASNSNGSTNAADPDDQYPIENNVGWQFPGANGSFNSIGTDWAAFTVGPNSNTGLMPSQAYGMALRLTRELPAENATVRITGFGSDSGTTNFTNQTDTGPFVEEIVTSATDIQLRYRVDTEGGNSGSPVIWEAQNLAFGIHTNAGCSSSSTSANSGTSLEHDTLETWISVIIGARYGVANGNVRHVDINHPLRVTNSGTPYRPYSTIVQGATNVPNDGLVCFVGGTYTAAAGNVGTFGTGNKAMIFIAPSGTATIGQ